MGLSQTYYILEKPLLNDWVKYLNDFNTKYPGKKTTMIETFTRRFGDEKLTKMLLAAKEVETTKLMATDLQTKQINTWLRRGDTADDVFTLLKLDKVEDKFFDSPLLSTWTAYLEAFNKATPDKKTSLFTTLLSHYRDGALFKIVDEASRVAGMEQVATKWQAEKVRGWLGEKKSPDDVLVLVGLAKPRADLLSTSLFTTWLNYVKAFNKANPGQKVNFYSRLHAHYMDNWVETMVANAMTNPKAVGIAKVVQAERFKRSLNSRHFPDDLFSTLKLDNADNFLASRDFKLWTKYLSDFNQRYPKYKMTMIDALMNANKDYALTKMLLAAMKNAGTEKQATSLLRALMNKWVSAKKAPSEVSTMFKILKVGSDGPSLLKTYSSKFNRAWGSTAQALKIFDSRYDAASGGRQLKRRYPSHLASNTRPVVFG
jgi:hypothetical protein